MQHARPRGVEGAERHADEPHVVVQRQPADADVGGGGRHRRRARGSRRCSPTRLRCVSATPLGADVDPEVNCTNAMSSSDGGGGRCRLAGASRSSAHEHAATDPGSRARSVLERRRAARGRHHRPRAARREGCRRSARSSAAESRSSSPADSSEAGTRPAIDAPKSAVRNGSASGSDEGDEIAAPRAPPRAAHAATAARCAAARRTTAKPRDR